MTAKDWIYSNGLNRWNILGFTSTKGDALSSVYKISMVGVFDQNIPLTLHAQNPAGAMNTIRLVRHKW
jgi:hypothetical protein